MKGREQSSTSKKSPFSINRPVVCLPTPYSVQPGCTPEVALIALGIIGGLGTLAWLGAKGHLRRGIHRLPGEGKSEGEARLNKEYFEAGVVGRLWRRVTGKGRRPFG
jgi:hypothetical protein